MPERKRKRNPKTDTVKLAASGTTIRIEPPMSSRKSKKHGATAKVVVQEMNPVEGFVGFLRHYAIVGLSIGFIIGNQMSNLVKVIVASFIDPISHLLFGTALSQRTFALHFHGRVALFGWGAVAYGLIQIVFLLIFIYLAIRFFSLDKLETQVEKK